MQSQTPEPPIIFCDSIVLSESPPSLLPHLPPLICPTSSIHWTSIIYRALYQRLGMGTEKIKISSFQWTSPSWLGGRHRAVWLTLWPREVQGIFFFFKFLGRVQVSFCPELYLFCNPHVSEILHSFPQIASWHVARSAHLPNLQGIFEIGDRCAYPQVSLINLVNKNSINLVICTWNFILPPPMLAKYLFF